MILYGSAFVTYSFFACVSEEISAFYDVETADLGKGAAFSS